MVEVFFPIEILLFVCFIDWIVKERQEALKEERRAEDREMTKNEDSNSGRPNVVALYVKVLSTRLLLRQ